MAASLLPLVTRLSAEHYGNVEGCGVYLVKAAWQVELLKQEKDMATVMTPVQLEDALNDVNIASILAPKGGFCWEVLGRVLKRTSLAKTIFWEV